MHVSRQDRVVLAILPTMPCYLRCCDCDWEEVDDDDDDEEEREGEVME